MSGVRKQLGVTDAHYEWLAGANGGKCWICCREEGVKGRRLAVDHDHDSGQVRGLLCTSCNRRLGRGSTIEWLRAAGEYLVQARAAFGDSCPDRDCNGVGFIERRDGVAGSKGGRFVMRCASCARSWTCGFQTHGIPFAWEFSGVPQGPAFEAGDQ